MAFRSTVPAVLAVAAAIAIAVPLLAPADNEAKTGVPNAARGHDLAYTCYGCHGIANYKNVYPTYNVPKLQGQSPDYLVIALQGYRSGNRSHSTMHAQAASMSDTDMRDIAAFLSHAPIKAQSAASAAPVPKVVQTCVTCHGADGVGITPQYPTLAGQHADYIERALHDYKSGARKDPIMAGFAAQLKDADIKAVAEYYSKCKPGLTTAEHALWFGTKKK